ncbi:hypothetical protein GF323_04155 [Candidatus Woesearchaeota archaeon]|nr:hypothetical protein [Candidatus Woesearchaeota archaeon]
MNIRCLRCKGSNPDNCGRAFCPITAKSEARFKVEKSLNRDFQGSSPSPFIGRFGYPYVNVGFLSPPEIKDNAWLYDAPRYWSSHNYNISRIIGFRSELINSSKKAFVKGMGKTLEIARQIGMASAPVDLEVNLQDRPRFSLQTDSYLAPQGPNAKLKKASITSNPRIHTKIDRAVSDTGLKAADAVTYLYRNNFDENILSKLLSVGALGIKKSRKLVPTRWSITAADDMLGKDLINEIKKYPESDYKLHFGSYLGNYYYILLFPDVWGYELFETYMPHVSWNITKDIRFTTDYEPYSGRKYYAGNCAGGYYTVRLAIAEHLKKIRRQASVLAIRVITGEYAAPLGVWVTRQAARKAMQNKPISFASEKLMLSYTKAMIKKKFSRSIGSIMHQSRLLREFTQQKKLTAFI